MSATARPNRVYDHRLKALVHDTGDIQLATDKRVPRSTARGWLRQRRQDVVTLDIFDRQEHELLYEVMALRRRNRTLLAVVRLVLALLRVSGFTLAHCRLRDGDKKAALLRAIERARAALPLRAILRVLKLSSSRYYAWRRTEEGCTLADGSSCPQTSPHQLTPKEIQVIQEMVTSKEYRHVPTGTLAILAQRLGKVFASPATWYRLIRQYCWRRPRQRVHPTKPKAGIRASEPNKIWHIDTTVIRLLDGTKAYLHAVIDNFSRRILAWKVSERIEAGNTISVLRESAKSLFPSDDPPTLLADSGVGNVNAEVDALIDSGLLHRVLAITEISFSNSLIEAWWRSLKHQWLYLNSLETVSTIRRLVSFYVSEHNTRLPHSAFRGQTPDEMYFQNGDHVLAELEVARQAARQARMEANRSVSCETCQRMLLPDELALASVTS